MKISMIITESLGVITDASRINSKSRLIFKDGSMPLIPLEVFLTKAQTQDLFNGLTINHCELSSFIILLQANINPATLMNTQEFSSEQTPSSPTKLFQMFSTESPTKRQEKSEKWSNKQTMFCPSSHQQTINPFQLISTNHSSKGESDLDQSPGGDRYIPKRKLVKKESLMSQGDRDMEVENKGLVSESQAVSVSDLYLKVVMTDSPKKRKQAPIDSFENNNILKFSSKTPNPLEKRQMFQQTGLQWTGSVDKEGSKGRKISKVPVKVLDAPSLEDDYYLNLLDWGPQNYLSVGLSSSVYLWNASNSKVMKLCDMGNTLVTGVGWSQKDSYIAVGNQTGEVQVWDVERMKKMRSFIGHSNRVGAICWNSTILSTGSRDKTILNRDIRDSCQFVSKYEGHKQEVCGLKWSPDEQQLCSGGNDNRLLVWSPKTTQPVLKFLDHEAAVKAVAWSPHQHGLLVSGGGTADRTIRFRNTLTGATSKVVDAGSQVCSLMFSRQSQELVSTHGYQLNQVNIWKTPSMSKVATLTGHTSRVLYLAMNPDGSQIVTGAGDETLRFWNLFPHKTDKARKNSYLLQTQKFCLR